jgi:hypothetical protein
MLTSPRRRLTVALAVAGLTMLGTGGALAAADSAGGVPGGSNPVCTAPGSPLASTPACASTHQDPGRTAMAAQTSEGTQANPPEGGEAPGPTHPFCEGGSPLIGSPLCPSKWPPS